MPERNQRNLDITVVIPAKNEAGHLAELVRAVGEAMAPYAHEIIVVDDGSQDLTAEVAKRTQAVLPQLRILRHERSAGQSSAIRTGVLAGKGYLIATLDADGQNPPENLPRLIAPFHASPWRGRLGLVQGQRVLRKDSLSKRLASRIANGIRAAVLKDGVSDSGCGLKVFRRDIYLAIPYFDHLHRFMPAMVRREGFEVETVDVTHVSRKSGRSNYTNWKRGADGMVDLLAVAWLLTRRRLTNVQEIIHLP